MTLKVPFDRITVGIPDEPEYEDLGPSQFSQADYDSGRHFSFFVVYSATRVILFISWVDRHCSCVSVYLPLRRNSSSAEEA